MICESDDARLKLSGLLILSILTTAVNISECLKRRCPVTELLFGVTSETSDIYQE